MKKRILSLLMSVVMLFSCVVVPASAEPVGVADSDAVVTITPDTEILNESDSVQYVTYTIAIAPGTKPMVGPFSMKLVPATGTTLATELQKNNSTFYYLINSELMYNGATEEGLYSTYSYNKNSKVLAASGVENGGITSSKTILTIVAEIAPHTTGQVCLGLKDVVVYADGITQYENIKVVSNSVTVLKTPLSTVSAAVDAPVKGQAFDNTVDLGGSTAYTASVEWYEGSSASGAATTRTTAKGGQIYTAKITLTADTANGESFAATVTGPSGYTVNRVSNSVVELTKTFSKTDDKTVTGLSITKAPDKTAYKVGETFDSSGMTVQAVYDDNSTDTNFTGYTVENANKELELTDTEVTIKVGEVTAEQAITVALNDTTAGLFTFTTPTDFVYNGGDYANVARAAIAVKFATGELGTPTYSFYKDSAVVAAPTDAGTYTVKVSADAGTKYATVTDLVIGSFTIAPKALAEGDFIIGSNQAVYDGKEHALVYSTSLSSATDFDVTGVSTATNVGSSDYTVTFVGKGNYTGSVDKTWNLQKAKLTTSSNLTATATYGTKACDITNFSGGTVVSEDTPIAGTWTNVSVNTDVLSVGTSVAIELKFTPEDTTNYEIMTVYVVPTIEKADYTFSYTGVSDVLVNSHIAAISGATTATGVNSETVNGSIAWYKDEALATPATDSDFAAVKTGLKLYYKFTPASGQDNYNLSFATGSNLFNVVDIAFTVDGQPASNTNCVTIKSSPTYGDTWAELVTIKSNIVAKVGQKTGTSETYKLNVTGTDKPDAGVQSYKVLYSGTIDGVNYNNVEVCSGTVQVGKKSVNATAPANITKVYDGTATASDLVFTFKDISNQNVSVTVSGATYENANAGTDKAISVAGASKNATGTNLDNYDVNYGTVKGAITAKAVTATMASPTNITKEYDRGDAVSGALEFTFTGVSGEVTVDVTGATYDNANAGTGKTVSVANATKVARNSVDLGNYNVNYGTITGNITKKNVTVTITGNNSRSYNGQYNSADLTAAATLLGGDSANYTIKYGASELAYNQVKNAGTYALKVTGDNTNYTYSLDPNGVTEYIVYKADITPAPSTINMRYDNTAAHTVTAAELGISGVPGTVVIASATDANDIISSYNNDSFTLRSGMTASDTDLEATLHVSFTPSDTDNYNVVTSTDVTVKIVDKNTVTVSVSMSGWTYGDTKSTPAYSATGLEGGAAAQSTKYTVTYAGTGSTRYATQTNAPDDAGTYVVLVKYEDDANIGEGSATFTVAKRALTFTADVADKVFDGTGTATASNIQLQNKKSGDDVALASQTNVATLVGNINNIHDAGLYSVSVKLDNTALAGDDKDNYVLSGDTYVKTNMTVRALDIANADELFVELGTEGYVTAVIGTEAEANVSEFVKANLASGTDYTDDELGITESTEEAEAIALRIEAVKSAMAAVVEQEADESLLVDINVASPTTIVLAYPEGVTSRDDIHVTHMKADGSIEEISIQKMVAGIMFNVESGSPYLVTWEDTSKLSDYLIWGVLGLIGLISSGDIVTASTPDKQVAPGQDIKVTVDGAKGEVVSVSVDGVKIDSGNYTVSGSSVVLKGSYTEKLTQGYHTMTITYSSGTSISTRFMITGSVVSSAKTGDMGIALYVAMAAASSTAGAAWWVTRKKKEEN